jgi:hypothetical protein
MSYGNPDNRASLVPPTMVSNQRVRDEPAGSLYRDFFFVSVVLIGIVSLAASLISKRRIDPSPVFFGSPKQVEIDQVASDIDRLFEQEREAKHLPVADQVDELQAARRLSLGLAGTIPSLEEIRMFEKKPASDRWRWWTNRLLDDERCHDHLAERFARAFVGVEDGEFFIYRRRKFTSWLAEQIAEERRYDSIVKDLIRAKGIWTDQPAVNFLTKTIEEEGINSIVLAGRTSRAFLGMRIDCLQCHDDFLGNVNLGSAEDPTGGMQNDFHALAAFFQQAKVDFAGVEDHVDQGPYQYQLLDEDAASEIEPAFPFNRHLDRHESTLRNRLANWVTHPENKPFARAAVNRVWAIMTGRPLIEPVDDIPIDGPFPAAMERLVEDFVVHDFSIKRLIRIIAATKTFRIDSRANFEITNNHEQAWSVFPMTRIRPDQAAAAIGQASVMSTMDQTSHILARLTQFGRKNDFIKRFGDPGEDEFEDRGETVTQRLLMLNGNMIAEQLSNDATSTQHVAKLAPDARTAVEVVFLCTLTRRPTSDERAKFEPEIEGKKGNQKTRAIVDLYWALLNSAEFRWNH